MVGIQITLQESMKRQFSNIILFSGILIGVFGAFLGMDFAIDLLSNGLNYYSTTSSVYKFSILIFVVIGLIIIISKYILRRQVNDLLIASGPIYYLLYLLPLIGAIFSKQSSQALIILSIIIVNSAVLICLYVFLFFFNKIDSVIKGTIFILCLSMLHVNIGLSFYLVFKNTYGLIAFIILSTIPLLIKAKKADIYSKVIMWLSLLLCLLVLLGAEGYMDTLYPVIIGQPLDVLFDTRFIVPIPLIVVFIIGINSVINLVIDSNERIALIISILSSTGLLILSLVYLTFEIHSVGLGQFRYHSWISLFGLFIVSIAETSNYFPRWLQKHKEKRQSDSLLLG